MTPRLQRRKPPQHCRPRRSSSIQSCGVYRAGDNPVYPDCLHGRVCAGAAIVGHHPFSGISRSLWVLCHQPHQQLNNWAMPNSPSGGCGPFFIRGDGLYFDFTRACRQHDLAYRWAPVLRLPQVEARFLGEMLYDCSLRGPVSRVLRHSCGLVRCLDNIVGRDVLWPKPDAWL